MKKLTNLTSLLISSILFLILTSLFAANIQIVSIIAICLSVLPAVWFLMSLYRVLKGFINRTNEVKNPLLVVIGLFIVFAITYFGIRNFFWVEDSGFITVTEFNVYEKNDKNYFIVEDIHYEVSDEIYEQLILHVTFDYEAAWNKFDRGYSKHLNLLNAK